MKQNVIDDYNLLSGQQKAAILMMSLDEDKSAQIFALMDDEEIKELSVIMASLGKVNSNVVEQLFQEFAEKSSNTGTLIGTFESPENFAMEIVMRMLRMDSVQKEVLDGLEKTLRKEFMSNLSKSTRRDSHELIADIFNSLDRNTEGRFMEALEERNRESAERVKSLMFTFEDLVRVDSQGIQVLLRNVDKDKLAIALKGASETIKDLFFNNMSSRAGKIIKEDMEAMGPVRLRDVEEAQQYIVTTTKELSNAGEIVISEGKDNDELIY